MHARMTASTLGSRHWLRWFGFALGLVACSDADSAATSDSGGADDGKVHFDGGSREDGGGPRDAGARDSGTPGDAGARDSGTPSDAGARDSGTPSDAGARDSGTPSDAGNTNLTVLHALQVLAGRKLYFAHNSVGSNILDGLDTLSAQYGVGVKRQWYYGAQTFDNPVFAESGVSTNGAPLAKIADFETVRMAAVGSLAKYAFFKLCYIDFDSGTDTQALANAYVASAARLRAAYPSVTFVHFTAPLCPSTDASNDKRNDYNERIRAAFSNEPLFDLALAESTRSDGTRVTYASGGHTYSSLASEWANGCHLNAAGGRAMAEALVKFLAALP